MPKTQIPLIKGDKVDSNVTYRDALPVNMTVVQRAMLGTSNYLLSHPGLTTFATGKGTDRGALFNERQNTHFRVSGTKLISLAVDGTVTELGGITGTKQASLPYSFNTQAIIADGKMWLYEPTGGLVQVTDPDLGSPIDGTWIDGYYFLTDGEYIYHTDISSESSIDPLKFATAEFSPDPTLAVAKTQDNKVMVFGRYSIEYFIDRATDNFAFQRIDTRAQKIGIVATHAKCEVGPTWCICGSRKHESLGIYLVGVGEAKKVSTEEIDKILAQYSDVDLEDIRMESRLENNVYYVLVHLPNETLLYNAGLDPLLAWTKLASGKIGGNYQGVNGVYDTQVGAWIYGDKCCNNIGRLDHSTFAQYGIAQELYLYSPFINLETMSVDELEIQTIPGFNVDDDATVAVAITTNGYIYSTEEWNLYSKKNKYNYRFILRRLGYVEEWIGFRFRAVTKSRMAFAALMLTYG